MKDHLTPKSEDDPSFERGLHIKRLQAEAQSGTTDTTESTSTLELLPSGALRITSGVIFVG